jgi:acyl-CoA-binding protein
MVTEQEFNQAQQDVQNLNERPSNDDLLLLYALYKQATDGDVSGERPGGFDFKAMAKYDAWKKQAGKSPEEARTEYVATVKRLQG